MAEVVTYPLLSRPRLVAAEEVEDDDPARAELIRLQVADAAVKGADPELRVQIDALLVANRARWTADVPDTIAVGFGRGFIEEITLSTADFLSHGSELFWTHPISFVRLTTCDDLEKVLRSPHWERVCGLDLSGTDLDDAGAAMVAGARRLTQLAWLSVADNPRLGATGVRALVDAFDGLRWLDTRGTGFDVTPTPGRGRGSRIDFWQTPPGWSALRDELGVRPWMVCDAVERRDHPPAWWHVVDVGTDLPAATRPTLDLHQVVQRVLAQAVPRSQLLLVEGWLRGGQRPRRRIGLFTAGEVVSMLVDCWVEPDQLERVREALFTTYEVIPARWDARRDKDWGWLWVSAPAPFCMWNPGGRMFWVEEGGVIRRDGPLPEVESVEAFVSSSWVARGIRLRHDTTVTPLVMEETTEPEADPSYDKVDLDVDTAYLTQLGEDLAAALEVPFIDLIEDVCQPSHPAI